MEAPQERLDLVIFGGTGYTGRLAVLQMAVVMNQHPGIRWGVAGRSRGKLEAVLREAKEKGVDTSDVAILLADVDDAGSLSRLCRSCRLVVNCCGPYARYGERVVAAAVAEDCHHVDVSAENHFTRLLESKYEAASRKAGVYVVTSCGLSSVPVDVGVTYLEQNFQGTLGWVDSYLTTHPTAGSVLRGWRHGVIRYSSWESMIHGMAQKKDSEEDGILPEKRRPLLHRRLNRWCVPYPISDAFVVARSQRRLAAAYGKRPVRYNPYLVIPNLLIALFMLAFFLCVKMLAKMSWTRNMLLKYPRLCSFGMVSYDRDMGWVKNEVPYKYVLIGRGWEKGDDINEAPDKNIEANITVRGTDPAFAGTVAALLACAVTLLYDENMPSEGGVMTPGFAFYRTHLKNILEDTGTYTFQMKSEDIKLN